MRHGQGKIVWKAGGSYEGGWKSGHQDGLGTLITRNGFTFHGNWDKCVMTYCLRDNLILMMLLSSCFRNELNGEGTKTWNENGKLETYRGNFCKTKVGLVFENIELDDPC